MNIDRKFRILAVNPCKKGVVYTEDDGVFFCAKDAEDAYEFFSKTWNGQV